MFGINHKGIRPILLFLLSAGALVSLSCCGNKESEKAILHLKPTKDVHSLTGIYIPADLQDCFVELKKMLPSDFIERIKEKKKLI